MAKLTETPFSRNRPLEGHPYVLVRTVSFTKFQEFAEKGVEFSKGEQNDDTLFEYIKWIAENLITDENGEIFEDLTDKQALFNDIDRLDLMDLIASVQNAVLGKKLTDRNSEEQSKDSSSSTE